MAPYNRRAAAERLILLREKLSRPISTSVLLIINIYIIFCLNWGNLDNFFFLKNVQQYFEEDSLG